MAARASRGGDGGGRVLAGAALVLGVLGGVGCFGPRDFENENDRLRRELLEARSTIIELEGRVAEAEAAADAAANGQRVEGAIDPRAVPRVVRLAVSTAIHRREATPGTGRGGVVLIARVATLDGRGRFVQAVGELTARVVGVGGMAGSEPRVLGERTLTPIELREAYRSSFAGTRYRVEIPLSTDPIEILTFGDDSGTNAVACVVTYVDAPTGRELTVVESVADPRGRELGDTAPNLPGGGTY